MLIIILNLENQYFKECECKYFGRVVQKCSLFSGENYDASTNNFQNVLGYLNDTQCLRNFICILSIASGHNDPAIWLILYVSSQQFPADAFVRPPTVWRLSASWKSFLVGNQEWKRKYGLR